MIPFSILDLSPINEGSDPTQSFSNTLDLARHAEHWGYQRYWLAEHRYTGNSQRGNCGTDLSRGGRYIPYTCWCWRDHAAKSFSAGHCGTVWDSGNVVSGAYRSGVGQGTGADQLTARALRRTNTSDPNRFPDDVVELLEYFADSKRQAVRAVPGAGLNVPVWILGSSLFGAQVAAALGLPYAFASHFAPDQMMQALELYRTMFKPSSQLRKPYVMLGYNVFAADKEADAQLLATSVQQAFVNLRSGHPKPLPPPSAGYMDRIAPHQRDVLEEILCCAAIGIHDQVRQAIAAFIAQTGADELMITSQIFDHAARLRSYEITAAVRDSMR